MRQVEINQGDSVLGSIGVQAIPVASRKTYISSISRKVRKTTGLNNVAIIGLDDLSGLELTFIHRATPRSDYTNFAGPR